MRILFVLDTWSLVGGTERHAAVTVPELVARGHDVVVLCRAGDGAGMPAVPREAFEPFGRPDLSAAEREELSARVAALAPDVVFVSALRNVDALEVLVDAAPVVRYVHDHTPFCPGLNKVYEAGGTCLHALGFACLKRYWLDGGCTSFKPGLFTHPLDPVKALRRKQREMRVTGRAARVLTNSSYMRDQLVVSGLDPARTAVLHYFTGSNTPAQPFAPLPAELAARLARSVEPVLFTPARLTLPDKGVDYLLTALGKLASPFLAVVTGEGPAAAYLRSKAADEGLADRVVFTGWLGSGAIETLYARSDVVVCPSVWDEPFGLVGIEAMAHAKPVVAFEVGGIPDWLEPGRTGLVAPRYDALALARAIDRLLADPELRSRMGTAGRAVVAERFRRETHVDGLETALRAALAAAVA